MTTSPDPFDIPITEVVECAPFRYRADYEPPPTARLELIAGRNQAALERANILLVGVGGQSIVAQGLLRSGATQLTLCDPDFFDITNMSRQLGYARDRGHSKAHRVARNLRGEAVNGATIRSIALPFPEALMHVEDKPDVVACLVDDNVCRLAVAEYGLHERVPVVISGLSRDGARAYVFLQLPDGHDAGDWATDHPCLVDAVGDLAPVRMPCVAAAIKTAYLAAGYILHFIDVALMGWAADAEPYNLVYADLNGRIAGHHLVARRPDCWFCGGA